ncbi:MAG: hypothetical protein M9949_09345 [Candidatus Kapabacteria bacterium]|nr:hypothetical protein [Candidatus Kapabacteria bacterium]
MKNFLAIIIITVLTFWGCSDEKEVPETDGVLAPDGISFSGYNWQIKSTDNIADSRYFCLTDKSNVRIDDEGHLVLKLTSMDAIWHGAELITQEKFGFGTFKIQIETDFTDFDRNVSFMASAINVTEDIFEGMTQAGLRYSFYGEENNPNPLSYILYATDKKYAEEYNSGNQYSQSKSVTTHEIKVLPDELVFESYSGTTKDEQLAKYSTKTSDGTGNDFLDISFSKTFPSNKFIFTVCLGEFNEPEKGKDVEIKILKFEFIPHEDSYSKK